MSAALPTRRRIHLLALLLLCPASGWTAGAALSLSECRLEHPQGLTSLAAECGTLQVPENRANPTGRQISLFVARIPALSRKRAPDPLFILAGGPGLGASTFYAAAAPAFARINRDRDLILVDQRGTGRSGALLCPFAEQQLWDTDEATTTKLMRQCRDALAVDHDLAQYTTSVAVADLDAVRAALGYAAIDLYGSSYGTRVAQHYARRYPQHTRALILDGVIPPQRVLGTTTPLDAEQTLQRIFSRCRETPECRERFGDPEQDYLELREQLGAGAVAVQLAHPRSGEMLRLEFTTQLLAGALRLASYSADQAALLPLALTMANREKRFEPLAAQYLVAAAGYDAVLAYGMHNSVVCSEDVPLFNEATLNRRQLEGTFLGTAQIDSLRSICAEWPVGPVDADLHQALSSKAPALLLSGTADPVTPAAFGDEAALGFTAALHLKFPDHGHGQLAQPCVDGVMARFLDRARPGEVPDVETSCVERIRPPPFFLSVNGPAP
ncbi:MAG: alpha/beta fold hydrolase [Steroidobacteraceae bacterium]